MKPNWPNLASWPRTIDASTIFSFDEVSQIRKRIPV